MRRVLLSLALALVAFTDLAGQQRSVGLRFQPIPVELVYGPRSSVVCPGGAVNVTTGTSAAIQTAIAGNPNGTAFCLNQAVYTFSGSITPKTGNRFTCVFGTVLDGTGGTFTDAQGGFGSTTLGNIDDVIIENCIIQDMPEKGIIYWNNLGGEASEPDTWTIRYNEVKNSGDVGVAVSSGATVQWNSIHGNFLGTPSGSSAGFSIYTNEAAVTVEDNELYNNVDAARTIDVNAAVYWRRNYIHDNAGHGIWNDGNGNGSILEYNVIEDNDLSGIHWEASVGGTIRFNDIKRNGQHGIFISTSQDTVYYENVIEFNEQLGVLFYVSCASIGQFAWMSDLNDNYVHHNIIRTTTASYGFGFSYTSDCTNWMGGGMDYPGFTADYLNNGKNNDADFNSYFQDSLSDWDWLWGTVKDFAGWKARPGGSFVTGDTDANSSVSEY